MAKEINKPGQTASQSGQYAEVGRGGRRVSNNEVTVVAGKVLPPTSRPGNGWINVDPTKHKRN